MDWQTTCGATISGNMAELLPLSPPTNQFRSSDAGARFGGGGVLGPLASDDGEEDSVLGEDEDDLADENVEDCDINDDDDSGSDSDYEGPLPESRDGEVAGNDDLVTAAVQFLGRPTRFASIQNTVGFMRIAGAEAARGQHGGDGEILVHYRYTYFSRSRSGAGHGVDVCGGGSKLHFVRFLVPFHAAADPAGSLPIAGAALAPLIYPGGALCAQLQALWSGLVAAASASARFRQRVARAKVTVDVGILRRGDRTPERMDCMRAALEAVAREADATPARYGMEQHLPAPVRCDEEDGTRPAKRRRFTGEECAVCYEVLERDVAAWPRCSHVFHGGCVKQLLLRGFESCPMCRSTMPQSYLQ